MKVSKELIKGSSEVLILSALKEEPLYGYEISKRIKKQSKEVFTLGEGTMYPILHRLEKGGFLESYWQIVGGRRRKYYELTRSGKKRLEEKTGEWKTFSKAVNAVVLAA